MTAVSPRPAGAVQFARLSPEEFRARPCSRDRLRLSGAAPPVPAFYGLLSSGRVEACLAAMGVCDPQTPAYATVTSLFR